MGRFADGGTTTAAPSAPTPLRRAPLTLKSRPTVTPTRRTNGTNPPKPSPKKGRFDTETPINKTPKAKPRSLWEQVNPMSVIPQATRGVGGFLKEVAEVPWHLSKMPVDVARNLGVPGLGESDYEVADDANAWQGFQASFRNYAPLVADMAGGVAHTANLTGIGSDENIVGRYQTAVEEGRWVDQLMNDAGNVALVAGPLAKALGSTAVATGSAAGASEAIGGAAAEAAGGRSLSAAARAGVAEMLPPSIKGLSEIPLRIPETRTTRIPFSATPLERSLASQVVQPRVWRGSGAAGAVERRALPGATVGELAAAKTPGLAAGLATAGDVVSKVGFGAQWLDPSEPLFHAPGLAKGAVGKLAPVVPEGVRDRYASGVQKVGDNVPVPVKDLHKYAQQTITRMQNKSKVKGDLDTQKRQIEQRAINAQFAVDENLTRLGKEDKTLDLDRTQRDLHGGVILDATDLALNATADIWARTPERHKAALLRSINEPRPKGMEFTAERLDLYNQYRAGKLDPRVTAILDDGMNRIHQGEEWRRGAQEQAGNLAAEQMNVPKIVDRDGNELGDYTDFTQDELIQAFDEGRVKLPWLMEKEGGVNDTLARRQEKVDEERAILGEKVEAVRPLIRQYDTTVAQRMALPKPGRNVPYDDTPGGRAELVAEHNANTEASLAVSELETLKRDRAEFQRVQDQLLAQGYSLADPALAADKIAEFDRQIAELEPKAAQAGTPSVQQSIAEALIAAIEKPHETIGTNPTPDGQWAGGTWGEGVVARAEAVAAGPADPYARPLGNGATDLIEEAAVLRQQVIDGLNDVKVAQKHLDDAQARVDGFFGELDQTQQDMIRDVSRGGVMSYREITDSINTTGVKLGGFETATDGSARLTGLVGDLAQQLGLYQNILIAVRAQREQLYRRGWDKLSPKEKAEKYGPRDATKKYEENAAFDRYVEARRRNAEPPDRSQGEQKQLFHADPGEVNLALNELVYRASRLTGDEARIWDEAKGQLEQAQIADDLHGYLNKFVGDNVAMGGHAAFTALESRIQHLPQELQDRHIGNDVINALNDAKKQYLDRFHRELQETVNRNMSYVPARFRTPLQEARRAVMGLYREADREWAKNTAEGRAVAEQFHRMAESAPTSFGTYVKANEAVPTHLIGGGVGNRPRRPRPLDAAAEVVVADVRGGHERQVGMRVPTLREYAGLEAAEMTRIASQQSVMTMAFHPTFSKSASDLPGVYAQMAAWKESGKKMPFSEFERIVEEQGWAVVKGATSASTPGLRGVVDSIEFNQPARLDEMTVPGERRDMVVTSDPMTGDPIMVDADTLLEMNRIPDVRVVPTYLAEVMDDFVNPRSNRYAVLYDQVTQLWKTATLAWSVAWVTYNAVGNMAMAGFSYGQSPSSMVRNIAAIRNELRAVNEAAGFGSKAPLKTAMKYDSLSAIVPTRMAAHGASWAERASTMQVTGPQTRMGSVLDYLTNADESVFGRVTEFSYTLNEFTDNMFRTSVLMEDAHRRLKKEAQVPKEYLNPDGSLRGDLNPAETQHMTEINAAAATAIDKSVRAALNTMGDFTRLTKFERTVVKRIFPFYPWLRHQTAMAVRMPLQNPMRWAWMASLSDMLGNDDDGDAMNALMSGFVPSPVGFIPISGANPFTGGATAVGSDTEGMSLFDPKSMLGAINPLPKTAATMLTGIDFAQGEGVSRPMDQKRIDKDGQLVGGSTLSRLTSGDPLGAIGEAGFSLAALTPQTKGLRDLALGGEARYDSGDVVPYADERPHARLNSLARIARVPFWPVDLEHRIEVAKEKDRLARAKARGR